MNRQFTYELLLAILMVAIPHAAHLPIWVSALCAALLMWRAYLTYSGNQLPRRWLLTALTVAMLCGILLNFHTLFGREVGVTLLILLTTLKFMELRSARDATVLIYLACFIIITNFFYSQSMLTALFMLATLIVIITAWIHLHAHTTTLKARLSIAATLLLQAMPLMLVLFVLFPRVQGPLWGLPQDAYSSSGLDDRMTPGSLSRLILSEEVAFRVSYAGQPPLREQMYWRGPVLWQFDGRTWTPGRTTFSVAPQFTATDQPVDYSVTLEPHNKTWLFALDMPERISVPAMFTHDFQVLQEEPVKARLRYEARSNLGYRVNLREAERQIRRALQLPRSLNPRALQLAAEWRTQAETNLLHSLTPLSNAPVKTGVTGQLGPTTALNGAQADTHRSAIMSGLASADQPHNPAEVEEAIVRTALAYFNQHGFQYTLEPPPLGEHGVDDFLFTTRQGFCEHYASSFVFLMRAASIPARVVTGYQGGEFNETGNYYIVRQSDAHAWAEIWLKGKGWVRIDPTAAIAPARVQRGMSVAVTNNAALPFMARNPPLWLQNLRLNLDAMAFQWNQWVLGYNSERQFAFMTNLGMESVTWQKMAMNMAIGTGLSFVLLALFMLRHLFNRRTDKVQVAWLKLCQRMARAGLARASHEGALAYAARIAEAKPHLAASIHDLATRYNALRYGAVENELAYKEFFSLCSRFPSSVRRGE